MNIQKTLQKAIKKLNKHRIPSAHLSAELLLSHVLKKPRSFLYIWSDKKLTKKQINQFDKLIKRRLKFEPVAYLIKRKEFYGLDFYVDKNVMVPRPETECLVEEILRFINVAEASTPRRIADIGTGSGCLAITLKKYLPKAKIYASDISKRALLVAKKNTKKNKVKIFFKQGNLLEPFFSPGTPRAPAHFSPSGTPRAPARGPKFDIIVANLPYLTPQKMKQKTIQAEPKEAFHGGKKGLDVYKELFTQIKEYKIKAPIFIEIDPDQTTDIKKIVKTEFPLRELRIEKDLSGQNRVVVVD